MIGESLGPYKILEPLGAGGMGEVYRARDTKLDRDVAVKVLPDDLAADPDRLARFEREAKLLAALSHANIGSIYSLEASDAGHFLVLELIEGESLERRLQRGAIPAPEALDIARQIAEALEAAHDAGIIHRDVKPANVMLTANGGVKVLDFGIAKSTLLDNEANTALAEQATSLTVNGTLMGTPPYMAPEQIRGEEIDRRADIWAFGCVAYEMLTGAGAFTRETVADTLVAVLETEPDWDALSGVCSSGFVSLLRRCLRKDAHRRLHDVADARIELEDAARDPKGRATEEAPRVAPASRFRLPVGTIVGAVFGALLMWVAVSTRGGETAGETTERWQFVLPSGQALSPSFRSTLAITPDGSTIFYAASQDNGPVRLHWRSRDGSDGGVVPDSDAADAPFVDPTGEWLGFIKAPAGGATGEVWKWRIGGEASVPVGNVAGPRQAAWGPGNKIVVGSEGSGLQVLGADGRSPAEPLTFLDGQRGDFSHRNPSFLPDGRVLFNINDTGNPSQAMIAVLSLESGEIEKTLDVRGAVPRYVESGHLLFGRVPDIYAVAFDPVAAEPFGAEQLVIMDVDYLFGRPEPKLAVSDDGLVVYQRLLGEVERELVWLDLEGGITPVGTSIGSHNNPRLSPDGRGIATTNGESLWIYDGVRERRIEARGQITLLAWAGDEEVFFAEYRGDTPPGVASNIYKMGSSAPNQPFVRADLPNPEGIHPGPELFPMDLDTSGEWLLFAGRTMAETGDRGRDVLVAPTADPSAFQVLVENDTEDVVWARFAPNSQWIAYGSQEERQVWTQPFPGDRRVLVSSAQRAECPLISPQGDRIYYLEGPDLRRLMSQPVRPADGRPVGAPVEELVLDAGLADGSPLCRWDIHPQGNRFLMTRIVHQPPPANHLEVISGWWNELRERVPTGR